MNGHADFLIEATMDEANRNWARLWREMRIEVRKWMPSCTVSELQSAVQPLYDAAMLAACELEDIRHQHANRQKL